MTNKYAYIQTSDDAKLIRVCLHEENDYDQINQVELVDSTEIPSHAFNLINTLKREWIANARTFAKSEGLKLRKPDTMAIR